MRKSGKYKEAIHYYERALAREPENFHLLMSAGQTFLQVGDYSSALEQFYHCDYLKPNSLSSLRAIAWGELLNGNYEKAGNVYSKLLENSKADKVDFLNAAHAAMVKNDFKSAVKLYAIFVEKSGNNITDLILAFKEDAEILKQLKIKTSDLRLVVDKIRYDLRS